MDEIKQISLQPDCPFRIGAPGKYKLLVKDVEKKYNGYEYLLLDGEGREYKANSSEHYSENQLLRCVVTFTIKSAKLVLMDIAICKKQDLALPVQDVKHVTQQSRTKPAKDKTKSNSPFVTIDVIQNNGQKKGPMTDEEIQIIKKQIELRRDQRKPSYRCCGKTHSGLFEFRKHLYECHPQEYSRYFVGEFHQSAPTSVRGVGIKTSKSNKRNLPPEPKKVEGEYFHLIYTPMGNKR